MPSTLVSAGEPTQADQVFAIGKVGNGVVAVTGREHDGVTAGAACQRVVAVSGSAGTIVAILFGTGGKVGKSINLRRT